MATGCLADIGGSLPHRPTGPNTGTSQETLALWRIAVRSVLPYCPLPKMGETIATAADRLLRGVQRTPDRSAAARPATADLPSPEQGMARPGVQWPVQLTWRSACAAARTMVDFAADYAPGTPRESGVRRRPQPKVAMPARRRDYIELNPSTAAGNNPLTASMTRSGQALLMARKFEPRTLLIIDLRH